MQPPANGERAAGASSHIPEVGPQAPSAGGDDHDRPAGGRRDVIWVLSHSDGAGRRIVELLASFQDKLPRPAIVHAVALGTPAGANWQPPPVPSDARLRVAIIVLERQGLTNEALRSWAKWCMLRVASEPDFRLYVCLEGLAFEELCALTHGDPLLEDLIDTVQIPEKPSAAELEDGILRFLQAADWMRAYAQWRSFQIEVVDFLWRAAGVVQLLSAGAAVALTVAARASNRWAGLSEIMRGTAGGPIAAFSAICVFPLQATLAWLAFAGRRHAPRLMRTSRKVRTLVVLGMALPPCLAVALHRLQAPPGWVVLGLVLGGILDVARRCGYHAQRSRISIERALAILQQQLPRQWYLSLRGAPQPEPLLCPILPVLRPKVFISYSRGSQWSRETARAIATGLKREGVECFLDRTSIPDGASWRRALADGIRSTNVFITVLDKHGMGCEWVAAEALAAAAAHRLTFLPDIIVVAHPELSHSDLRRGHAVFQAIWPEPADGVSPGDVRVVRLREGEVDALVSAFRGYVFSAPSILPPPALLAVLPAYLLAGTVGLFSGLAGLVCLPLAVSALRSKFDVAAHLPAPLLAPAAIFAAYLAAFALRLAIAAAFEFGDPRTSSLLAAVAHAVAAGSLAAVSVSLAPHVSPLIVGWSIAASLVALLAAAGFVDATRKRGLV